MSVHHASKYTERDKKEREIAQERATELIADIYEEMRNKCYSEKEQIAILSQIKSMFNKYY
jgi:hypothetical protein